VAVSGFLIPDLPVGFCAGWICPSRFCAVRFSGWRIWLGWDLGAGDLGLGVGAKEVCDGGEVVWGDFGEVVVEDDGAEVDGEGALDAGFGGDAEGDGVLGGLEGDGVAVVEANDGESGGGVDGGEEGVLGVDGVAHWVVLGLGEWLWGRLRRRMVGQASCWAQQYGRVDNGALAC